MKNIEISMTPAIHNIYILLKIPRRLAGVSKPIEVFIESYAPKKNTIYNENGNYTTILYQLSKDKLEEFLVNIQTHECLNEFIDYDFSVFEKYLKPKEESKMKEVLERVRTEQADLLEKILKLKGFIGAEPFNGLHHKHKELLKEQLMTMENYYSILSKRIALFELQY